MSEKSLKERFQEKLDGSRWTGSTNNIGYPKMKVDGEMVLGSHVALRLAGRKAPTGGPAGGKIVMHKDNNKLNLSPSNLEVGTHKENLKQMRDEGRDRPRGVHQEPDEKTAVSKNWVTNTVAKGGHGKSWSRIRSSVSRHMDALDGPDARASLPELSRHQAEKRRAAMDALNPHQDSALDYGDRISRWGKEIHPATSLRGVSETHAARVERAKTLREEGLKQLNRAGVDVPPSLPPDSLDGVLADRRLFQEKLKDPNHVWDFGGSGPTVPPRTQPVAPPPPSAPIAPPSVSPAPGGSPLPYIAGAGALAVGGGLILRHHLKKKEEAASEKSASTDIDILKFAFKLQGETEFQEIPIAIENRKGSVRKGTDKDGKPWRTVMKMPYGYIKGSKGADGEDIDCYVGPHKDAPNAYVVHQRKSDGTGYDEDKILFGIKSKDDAVKRYLQHYNSDKFLGPVKEVPVERLKDMLSTGKKLEKISASLCARVLRRG